jgi:hypothetical protein
MGPTGATFWSRGAGPARLNLEPNQVVGMNALEMFETSRPQLERALQGETVSYETSGELNEQPWSFLTFVTPIPGSKAGIVGFDIDMTEVRLARPAATARLHERLVDAFIASDVRRSGPGRPGRRRSSPKDTGQAPAGRSEGRARLSCRQLSPCRP